MRIIPNRGLNIGTGTVPVHAPAGVAVEVSDALGYELLNLDVATRAPDASVRIVQVVLERRPVETAAAPPAPETAVAPAARKRRAQ